MCCNDWHAGTLHTRHAQLCVGLQPLFHEALLALCSGSPPCEVHLRHVVIIIQQRFQLLLHAQQGSVHPCGHGAALCRASHLM